VTRCTACGGELYADQRSVADAKFAGYRGGRITCRCGHTSIWLTELLEPRPVFVFERYGHEDRDTRVVECERCHCDTPTRGSHTKWCIPCRDTMRKIRSRESSRRHVHKMQMARKRRAVA
jgi:hypothetical protein